MSVSPHWIFGIMLTRPGKQKHFDPVDGNRSMRTAKMTLVIAVIAATLAPAYAAEATFHPNYIAIHSSSRGLSRHRPAPWK